MFRNVLVSMYRYIDTKRWIILILLVALVLRLVAINQSLWLDEAIGAIAAKDYSYWKILTEFARFDNHPPLFYLLLKIWTSFAGYSEIALRIPSIIFGLGTVYLTYLIGLRLAGKNNTTLGLVAALLVATSQFHIYFSQEARMYSMAALLASVSIYSFISILQGDGDHFGKHHIGFSLSILLLIFTDYVPIFLLPTFFIAGIVEKKGKRWWVNYLVSHIPLIIMLLIWVTTFVSQVKGSVGVVNSLPGWGDVVGKASVKQAVLVWIKLVSGRISFANKIFHYSFVAVASVPVLVALVKVVSIFKNKVSRLICFCFVVPLTLGFLVSFIVPSFIYFRYLFVVPSFWLIIAWGALQYKNLRLRKVIIFSIFLINLFSWIIYVTDNYQQRENWRGAVNFIESTAEQGEVVVFEFPEPFAPYRWYKSGNIDSYGVTDAVYASRESTVIKTKKVLQQAYGVYYFEYLRDISDPNRFVESTIQEEGYLLENINNFQGVGHVYYYTRNNANDLK